MTSEKFIKMRDKAIKRILSQLAKGFLSQAILEPE